MQEFILFFLEPSFEDLGLDHLKKFVRKFFNLNVQDALVFEPVAVFFLVEDDPSVNKLQVIAMLKSYSVIDFYISYFHVVTIPHLERKSK